MNRFIKLNNLINKFYIKIAQMNISMEKDLRADFEKLAPNLSNIIVDIMESSGYFRDVYISYSAILSVNPQNAKQYILSKSSLKISAELLGSSPLPEEVPIALNVKQQIDKYLSKFELPLLKILIQYENSDESDKQDKKITDSQLQTIKIS